MTIADRLNTAMQDANFPSQAALARASGVPQPTINRILKGTGVKGPETGTIVKLAAACSVRPEWLMSGIGLATLQAPSGNHEADHMPSTDAAALGIQQVKAARADPRVLAAVGLISDREAQVLAWFRMALEPGKVVIETAARAVEKKSLAPVVNNQLQVDSTGTAGRNSER